MSSIEGAALEVDGSVELGLLAEDAGAEPRDMQESGQMEHMQGSGVEEDRVEARVSRDRRTLFLHLCNVH